jgi:hypothetical protein
VIPPGRSLCRLAFLLIAACLATLAVTPRDAAAYAPRASGDFFGISFPRLWDMSVRGQTALREIQLAGMQSAGIEFVRTDMDWPEIEPTAPEGSTHAYKWTVADGQVTALAQHQLRLLPTLMGAPGWARDAGAADAGCGRRSAVDPARAADFGAFAKALVQRYGPHGSFWIAHPELPYLPITQVEVWNEANWGGFWCPQPDPESFARLMSSAADGIHAASPGVQAMLGGLAALKEPKYRDSQLYGMAADEFLRRAVAAQPTLATQVDAIGFHPYDLDPAVDLGLIGWFRRQMDDLGFVDANIALTEFGWLAGPFADALPESQRAANYTAFVHQLPRLDCGLTAIAPHTWATSQLDPTNTDDFWGIASLVTGKLLPSGQAYSDQIALYNGQGSEPAPRTTITLCGGALPDEDSDGVPDQSDDFPLDPAKSTGSGEVSPEDVDPSADRVHPPRVPDSYYGVDVVQLPDDDPAKLTQQYDSMHAARVGQARQRIPWAQIEPGGPSTSYSTSGWQYLDRHILKMGLQHIGLTPSFGVAPAWASVPGTDLNEAYADFMTRFARRYGAGGTFWDENRNLDPSLGIRNFEIWDLANQNSSAPDGSSSASEYAQMYAGARSALHSVDPDLRAIVSVDEGGQGGWADDFIRGMVAARPELQGHLDGVYVMASLSRTTDGIEQLIARVRQALDDTGNASAPIYLGFGAPTNGPGAITEGERAQLFRQVASRMPREDCGVGGIFAHAWTTPELSLANEWNWFGLADPQTAELRQTGRAYGDVAGQFLGFDGTAAPTSPITVCGGPAPDQDGDGTPDAADDFPLDATKTDGTPPSVSITAPTVKRRGTTFRFRATDASSLAGFRCRVDTKAQKACTSPLKLRKIAPGSHLLTVQATDKAGNIGVSSRTWRARRLRR